MKQKTYKTVASLVDGGNKISAGAATYAAALGLVVATKPSTDADTLGLTGAKNALHQAKHELRGLLTLQNQKRDVAYDVTFGIRDSLKRKFGRSYNSQWEGTRFSNSLKVPVSAARLEDTLGSLESFFAQNPQHESDLATAEIAGAALTALAAARAAVTVERGAVRTLLAARKKKEQAVRARIRGTVEELKRVIGPIDGRWDAFGLNQPGIQQAPVRPEKVSLIMLAGGGASLKWKPSARAEYYRLWMKVVGVDAEALPIGNAADLNFSIESFPAASQIEISLSAVNNGGESARSEAVIVTTP